MKDIIIATDDEVTLELQRYSRWLEEKGKNCKDPVSRLKRVDSLKEDLGYQDSILGLIVGRVKANKIKDAAGFALIIREQILNYYKDHDPEARSWSDVAGSLRAYALEFLLKSKGADEESLKERKDARKLATDIPIRYDEKSIKSQFKSRLTTQSRRNKYKDESINLDMHRINSLLSEYQPYQLFIQKLISDIIFFAYDPLETFDCSKPLEIKNEQVSKLLLDDSGKVLIRTKDDKTYFLLTPRAKWKSYKPLMAKSFKDLVIDHEPAISNQMVKLKSSLPTLSKYCEAIKQELAPKEIANEDKEAIVKDLEKLHEGIKLRIMDAKQNGLKSNH